MTEREGTGRRPTAASSVSSSPSLTSVLSKQTLMPAGFVIVLCAWVWTASAAKTTVELAQKEATKAMKEFKEWRTSHEAKYEALKDRQRQTESDLRVLESAFERNEDMPPMPAKEKGK